MRATNFEFRNRFWVMGLIFGVSFFCYSFDPVNAAAALLGAHTGGASTPTVVTLGEIRLIFRSPFGLDVSSGEGRHPLQVIFSIAALLVAGAAMMRTWATAYLHSDVVQDPNLRTEGLVADGPYRYVRNPLYFSNVLMTLSMGLMASRTGCLVIVAAMLVFQYRLIGREERKLLLTQGKRYRAYLDAVPRLWPSLRPSLPSGGLKPRWKQAWLAEAFFFWGFAAAMACFAVTLNPAFTFGLFALSMIVCLAIVPIWKRLRRGSTA